MVVFIRLICGPGSAAMLGYGDGRMGCRRDGVLIVIQLQSFFFVKFKSSRMAVRRSE